MSSLKRERHFKQQFNN